MPPVPAAPAPVPARDRIARLSILAGLVACAGGFVAHRLWLQMPLARAAELVGIAALVALPAWALVRWRGMQWATALALAWALAAVVHVGPVATLAAVALAMAALALGTLFFDETAPASAFVVGAGLLAGVLGWLLPWPVHHAYVYLPVAVALVAWRAAPVRMQLGSLAKAWRHAVDGDPVAAALAVVALGIASTGTWLPTLQHDDLAYHLGLPWQLQLHGRYALDPTHQVWALAPWIGDVLQAFAQVVGGREARGAVNALWLVAVATLLWRVAGQVGLGARGRWLVLALLATLPLLPALLAGMQTELPATAATLVLATLALDPAPPTRRGLLAVGVLVGMLAGLKLIHPVAALGLIAVAAWRHRRVAMRYQGLALALAAFVGGSSYAYAWLVAGNPVLPLLNGVFRSPYFPPANFADARWQGDGVATPWHLTFDTSRYLEGWDGGFGFIVIALAGALLIALRPRQTRLLAACALIALIAPLAATPYARYAFVGLVLVLPVAVHAVHEAFDRRAAVCIVLGVAALNFLFMPNANWLLHTGGAKRALVAGGRDEPLLRRYAPERLVYARIRATRPDAVVLDLDGATHAELAGSGRTATWYAPRLHAATALADLDASGRAWSDLLAAEGITDIVIRRAGLAAPRAAGLAHSGAYRVLTLDDVEWWRLPPRVAR